MPIWTVSNLQHRWKFCQSVLGGYWEQVFHQHLRGHLLTPLPGQWEWNLERLWAFASLTFPWHAGRPLLETTLHFLCSAGVVVATGGPEVNEADVRVIYHLTAPTPPTEQVITVTVRPSINYPSITHQKNQAHQLPLYPTISGQTLFFWGTFSSFPVCEMGPQMSLNNFPLSKNISVSAEHRTHCANPGFIAMVTEWY